jgi:hypothetical protein
VILRNRFTEAGLGSFLTDSLKLRRFEVSTEAEYRDHVSLSTNAGVATLRVGGNGQPDSSTLRWLPPQDGQEREPSNVGTHPPIPLHASQYSLSRDGKFLLVLRLMPHGVNIRGETGHFGLLDYFDVSNPKRPRRVGATLEADGPLDNGAVSDDGSRVAVAIIYPDAPPRNTTKVVVFDRVGRTLSSPRIVVPATSVSGLQFEGRFLFVGMQRPPLPVFVQTSTTRTIDLYDLGK